jgi:hypothetical protein
MKRILVIIAPLLLFFPALRAQMVGSNIFLQSNYLEVGITNNGSWGTCSPAPAGYHPRPSSVSASGGELASVYDWGHDGWTVGTPPYMGDYTYPGTPFEGWEIQVGSGRAQAFQNCAGTYVSAGLTLTGTNVAHVTTSDGVHGYWSGTAGSLLINKETSIQNNASAVEIKVKIKNTATVASPDIYYLRNCDPDIDATWPGGSSLTMNYIIYQNDTAHRVLVKATSSIASSTTPPSLSLAAIDARARCFAYSSWPIPSSVDLATVWSGTWAGMSMTPATLVVGDIPIGIIFRLGSIPAGDSVTFSYAYIYNGSGDIDSTFTTSCSGTPAAGMVSTNTPIACPSTPVVLSLSGYSGISGLNYQWQLSTDSVVWSNIAGATTSAYSFTGLTTTTWYRFVATCWASGASAISNVKKISYSVACPCLHTAGVCTPNTDSACTTTSIILNSTGYTASAGVALQWQSSPDSVTWTNIAGATTVPYTFTGLSATTFYRLKARCIATGVEVFSDARKITHVVICACAGTPFGGTATASTTYCSSCSLTLAVSGLPSLSGITYQWERSFNGVSSWGNILGATTATYTHAPVDAFHYRCKVKCTNSGLSAYSTSVYVDYPYAITADSIYNPNDTFCNQTRIYTRVNGVSTESRLKTFYGDGTSDSVALINTVDYAYLNTLHIYSCPGTYTVRRILYLAGMPRDTIIRTYTHSFCRTIPVKIFTDNDADCILNGTDNFNPTPVWVKVDSNGIAIDTISVTNGLHYRALGPVGTVYTFRVLTVDRDVVCPSTGVHTVTITAGSVLYPTIYFGIRCGTSITSSDLAIYTVMTATATNRQRGTIYLRNNLCLPADGTLYYRYSHKYNGHKGSSPSGDTTLYPFIKWTAIYIANHLPARSFFFDVTPPFSTPLTIGDTVTCEMRIIPTGSDADTTNNVIIRTDTVRGPYDPNIIEVSPAGCFDTATKFRFTVHFENLGNDTAHNVFVMDTLSPWLDPHSMEIILSSAGQMNIYSYNEGGYNIVKFEFPNIKLLDSSWKGLNDGAFIYDIKRRADMPTGASIFSRVGIYFDYNEVVMTNTVQNLKGCPLPPVQIADVQGNSVKIYPNPATTQLTIHAHTGNFATYSITNAVGQQVRQGSTNGTQTIIDIKDLPAGVYNITLNGSEGREVRKFVKW